MNYLFSTRQSVLKQVLKYLKADLKYLFQLYSLQPFLSYDFSRALEKTIDV